MPIQKIALIANGVTPDEPNALEAALRKTGVEVDVFDVRTMHQEDGHFVRDADGSIVDIAGYGTVARIIKGGVTGDSEKSWALQTLFEEAGAKPHIGVEAARRITDKILCQKRLSDKKVETFPSCNIMKESSVDASQIDALGQPPYVVRKNIGSAALSLRLADSTADAMVAAQQYLSQSGVIIHQRPPLLDAATATQYGLAVTEAENRSYQFRIVLVDGKIFGANIAYSEPNGFGLNIAQGATFKTVPLESIPHDMLKLAMRASDAHDLKIAAVDIALDASGQPRVLDMNASPDLSLTNERGEKLNDAVAKSIAALALKGPQTDGYRPDVSSSTHRTR